MHFTWDEDKRLVNIWKHGIDFIGVEAVFEGYTVSMEDDRLPYDEQRLVTLGLLQSRVVAVVHTEQGDTIRMISVRKASRYEQRIYFSHLAD